MGQGISQYIQRDEQGLPETEYLIAGPIAARPLHELRYGLSLLRAKMEHMAGITISERTLTVSRHIKSRERVRDLGEVYTQPREVNEMLDLVPDAFAGIDARFLEPAAGDGNFLVAILERKIAAIDEAKYGGTAHWYEFALLRCLASIYGIDISDENVKEARERLTAVVDAAHIFRGEPATVRFPTAVAAILATNIVHGDSIDGLKQIVFVEYTPLEGERFQRVLSELEPPAMDLFYEPPAPLPTVHYSEIAI